MPFMYRQNSNFCLGQLYQASITSAFYRDFDKNGLFSIKSRRNSKQAQWVPWALNDQHGIAISQKLVFMFNSFLISLHQKIETSKGSYHHLH